MGIYTLTRIVSTTVCFLRRQRQLICSYNQNILDSVSQLAIISFDPSSIIYIFDFKVRLTLTMKLQKHLLSTGPV
ncbi:hypothetical protein RSOLAG1IB_08951 [Rhizoctonia solani AG-1 IB]|uniref:Uncharacterized protein n=1 Tax=Thanatephorus cucumeris (strain AG1-IB / isolate 7/3/14) TaxID=1108050 RepID=A0A0B7FMK7_THACB|nr:hypothetical protein RSOLAG1IB_08951 [Rhizoctonia solani AG-1 IB]